MSGPNAHPLLAFTGHIAVGLLLLAALIPRARYILEPNVGDRRVTAAIQAGDWPADSVADVDPELGRALLQCAALAAHLLAALALTWLLGQTHCLAAGLFSLALWASLPIAILHGSLWGPENAGMACGLLCGASAVRWIRGGAAPALITAVLLGLIGLRVGPTAPCFAVAILLPLVRHSRGRLAVVAGATLIMGAWLLQPELSPERTLPAIGRSPLEALGLAALAVSAIGLLSRVSRGVSPGARERLDRLAVGPRPQIDLVLPLLAGALASLALEEGQSLVVLTPLVAASGAAFFIQIARPLLALRAGLAPVVVAVGLVALPGLAGFEHMRQQYSERGVKP